MIGYVRQLDLDGTLRIREEDHSYSPTLFEGKFDLKDSLVLKKAFAENLPIEFKIEDNKLVSVKIFKHPRIY